MSDGIHRPRIVDVKAAYCVAGTVCDESDEDDYKARYVEGLAKFGAEFDRWLREVKAEAWDECCEALAWAMHRGDDPVGYVHRNNPYRDDEDPRLYDSANDGALDALMHEDGES